jgi:hypothetical protein
MAATAAQRPLHGLPDGVLMFELMTPKKCEFEKTWETRCGNIAYRTNSCALHICKNPDRKCSIKVMMNEQHPSRLGFPWLIR